VPRIVSAIRKNHKLCIEHTKFEDEARERIICPLYIKQFRKRWYVIARDTEDGIIKSFGLDRISNVTELAEEFKKNPNEVADAIFTNVIGLFHKDGEPTTIRFWSEAYNANYLRTLNLHQSQIEIGPLNGGFEFEIKVVTNPEFFYEILKMGKNVKVLSPESVRTEMRGIAKTLTSYYN
jgi:predicted DNA-binding transcriptional regulator YafY